MFSKRCTGHCCKSFILPWISPDTFERERLKYKDNEDISKIFDMVIYLGNDPNQLPEIAKKIIPIDNLKNYNPDAYKKSHYYTCKWHDTLTGNCTNYENRPNMCRIFPDIADTNLNGSCEFNGCTKRFSLKQFLEHKAVLFWLKHKFSFNLYITKNFHWCFKSYYRLEPEYEVNAAKCYEVLND